MAKRDNASTSLTGKLLFWVTVITAASLLAVVFAATEVARSVLQRQIQRSAETAAEDVAVELIAATDPVSLIQQPIWSNKLLRRLSLRTGVRGIDIEVDYDGRSGTLSAYASIRPPDTVIDFDEVQLGQLVIRTAGERLEVVVHHALRAGEIWIRVTASTEVIDTFLQEVWKSAAWMGLAAWLILVLTIAVFIHRTISLPLRKVVSAMVEVGAGQLRQQVDDVGTAELEPLIDSFNTMSRRIAETEQQRGQLLDEIEELNRHLKRRVEEATAALASAQADLARKDRLAAMGELVGTIAHEVGTPLNSVLAHLDLLSEDLQNEADRERLALVVREIERVSEIIRRYLRSTRAPNPSWETVVVAELLDEAIVVFMPQAAANRVTLRIDAEPGTFKTDPDLIGLIVRNLVSNSLSAVDGGGRVVVSATFEDEALILTVSDDGVGMDDDTRARVFEPFFSARRDGTGTGLGMIIVRKAVETLGGRIAVHSKPKLGTSINVRIPVHPHLQPGNGATGA